MLVNTLYNAYAITQSDKELLEMVGFDTYDVAPHAKEIYLGTIPYDGGYIQLWLTAMPARFWRIKLMTQSGKTYQINTASGYLSKYWDVVEMMMQHDIEIERA